MKSLYFLLWFVGSLLKLVWFVFSLLGCMTVVQHAAGFWGIFVALLLLPLTAIVAPIYDLVAHGNWELIVWVWGGWVLFGFVKRTPLEQYVTRYRPFQKAP